MSLRGVSSSLSLSLQLPMVKVAELYDVALRDGNTYYYTSHGQDIVWNSITYTALPITRDPIDAGINLEINTCRVYLAGISGDLVSYVQENNLDFAELTIRRIVRGSSYASDNEWVVFKGNADVEFNRNILILELHPWIDSLNIQVPRCTYQETCNWAVFDDFCGLDRADYKHEATLTDANQRVVWDTAWSAGPDVPRFDNGEMVIDSGVCAGQRRPIASHDGHSFELLWPLPTSPSPGDSYTAYPGCDGRVDICLSWYDNTDNRRAYVYIPRIEEAML